MKKFTSVLLILCFAFVLGAAGCDNTSAAREPQNLLPDPNYTRGFNLSMPSPVYDNFPTELENAFREKLINELGMPEENANAIMNPYLHLGNNKLDYNKTTTGRPSWSLSEHSSTYWLGDTQYGQYDVGYNGKTLKSDGYNFNKASVEMDGTYVYSTPGKTVKVNPKTGELTLAVKGSNEYSTDDDHDGIRNGVNFVPRTDGKQNWVHLLISSTLYPQVNIAQMDSLTLNLSFTMEQMEKVAPELFNYNLHTAQFQLFFVVASSNPADQGNIGKGFWYGIPFYEARQTEDGEAVGPNGGWDNGTSMWIASAGTRATVGEPIQKGKRYDVKFDILKGIKEGLSQAKENGHMLSTRVEDLSISNFNLGWEVPGLYDVSVKIHNFEIMGLFQE